MIPADLHPAVVTLGGFVGSWRGHGEGHYPTIDAFRYVEEVTFGHVGKPFLTYIQRTRRLEIDGSAGDPLHAETGYLRAGASESTAEWMIAQPTGIVEIHEGSWQDGVLDLRARLLGSGSAKSVVSVRRRYVLDGGTLTYDLWMGAVEQPEQHHLRAELQRLGPPKSAW